MLWAMLATRLTRSWPGELESWTLTFLYTGPPPSVERPQGEYPTYVVQDSGRVVPVVQAYCYTKYIGHLQLQFDSQGELLRPVAGVGVRSARPVLLDHSVEQDLAVQRKLFKYQQVLQPYRQKVGSSITSLIKLDNQENLLGNLVTDSMLAAWEDVQVRSAQITESVLPDLDCLHQ